MQGLKTLVIGILIGIAVGSAISYGFLQFSNNIATKDRQIADLQAQILDLQNIINQNQEGTPTQTPTYSATPTDSYQTNSPLMEKLEFTSAYADYSAYTNSFTISLVLKNTGSVAVTIDKSNIFYNGKPADSIGYYLYTPEANFEIFTMMPGNVTSGLQIILPGGASSPWKSGMTVEVMIQTDAGKQYPKVITLP